MPTVKITGLILNKSMWQLVLHAFHDLAPDLRDTEVNNIRLRTPEDTGSLDASITGDLFGNADMELVEFYADEAEQIDAWGRVYAAYQEGPGLGLSTFTNAGHEMFELVLTDDLSDIQAWADGAARKASDLLGDN